MYRGELIPVGYNTGYASHADWVSRHLELEPGWKAKLSDSEIPFEVYKKYPKLIRLTSDIGEGWLFAETGSLNYDLETLLLKYITAFPKARFNIELSLADKNKIFKFPSSNLLVNKLRDLVRDPNLQVATASEELELLLGSDNYIVVAGGPEKLVAEYLSSQDRSLYNELKDHLDHLGYAKSLGVKTFKHGKQIYSILGS